MNSVEFITNEVSVNTRRRELHYVKPIGDHALRPFCCYLERNQVNCYLRVLASQNDTPHKITVHIKHVVTWVPYTLNPIPFIL